ncbi:hypothetical protein B0A54_16868 [Friedmanniomyces endolithicus]|uniref:BZIP domain-containing protein n=1 Tax=Friedmanniomyces endolithicus TaxID=329885 RepID=A0A4U0U2Y1_9PEZI|nr:hypothetical protein B0A54_16868 [Friedmanniomyces endolithicus]
MAFANPRLGHHHAQGEGKHSAYFEDDDPAALDPGILEADIMQSPGSAQMQYRKDSLANSGGVLSPADSQAWDHQLHGGLSVDTVSTGAHNAFHDEHNCFVRPSASHMHPHASAYGHAQRGSAWAFEHSSGNCTPNHGVEYVPLAAQYEQVQYPLHRTNGVPVISSHPAMVPHPLQFNGSHGEQGFIPAPQVHTPISPHCHQDWMGMAQQEMENRPMPKRMRPNSPPTTLLDFARRDGIRKKNGRIEIPQERNIRTIDELIDRTTDEDVLKELKQQKRLLRNREAALNSRQRRKKHTEDLEGREKNFGHTIAVLEKDVSDLAMDRERREEERQVLIHRFQESQRVIESLQDDIRSLKIQHNEETSQLRRRNNILTEQLAMDQAPAMSAAPSSTGFTDFNAEMEALNMGQHDWDDFFFVENMQTASPEDFAFPSRPEPAKPAPALGERPSSSTIVPGPTRKPHDTAGDQPIATGLLLMLLLCGAFVASKPPGSRPSDLPSMPPEVQAAAPAVLKDLLAEAGSMTQAIAPARAPFRPTNRLEQIHNRLTAPTRQQEIDQAFALTTAQYASITHMNSYSTYEERPAASSQRDAAPPPAPRPKRNLAEAMATLQQEHQRSSKAEVYTRSLLWDQIPAETVRQFREIVRENEEIEARQRGQQQQRGGGQSYKAEI